MTQTPPRKRSILPIHPFLLSAYPVLFLFQHNSEEVAFAEVFKPLAIVLGIAAVVLLLARLAFRDLRKAGLFTSVGMVLGLMYGHVRDLVDTWRVAGIDVGRDRYLMGMFLLVLVVLTLKIRSARAWLPEFSKILTVVGVVLLATTSIGILGSRTSVARAPVKEVQRTTFTAAGLKAVLPEKPRDIYYFIFDRYASAETLKRKYNFDNEPLLDHLRAKGFYVATKSQANYQKTALSLASSMNMRHIGELKNERGTSWLPASKMVQRPDIVRFLKSAGYNYYLLGNWWEPTRTSPLATATFSYDKVSEFSRVLLSTTALRSLGGPAKATATNTRAAHTIIAPYQFSKLKHVPELPGPKFVFAHILMPHPPYVFDRNGKVLSQATVRARPERENYVEQLRYTNREILAMVDRLLKGPEDERPIILIQSDEGPFPPGWSAIIGAKGKTDSQIREKFGILNAYYFPGVTDNGLYPSISPVNSFRKVLNLYFGTELPMLPDRSYVFDDYKKRYTWRDVTKIVRRP